MYMYKEAIKAEYKGALSLIYPKILVKRMPNYAKYEHFACGASLLTCIIFLMTATSTFSDFPQNLLHNSIWSSPNRGVACYIPSNDPPSHSTRTSVQVRRHSALLKALVAATAAVVIDESKVSTTTGRAVALQPHQFSYVTSVATSAVQATTNSCSCCRSKVNYAAGHRKHTNLPPCSRSLPPQAIGALTTMM